MTCTNPFISARHAAGAPDFSGPGFSEARRIILIAPESSPDTSPDAGAQVPDDVDRNRIAARLAELTEEMSALTAKLSAHEEAPSDSTDGATGEAMELE